MPKRQDPSVLSGVVALAAGLATLLVSQFVLPLGVVGVALAMVVAVAILRRDPFAKPGPAPVPKDDNNRA